MTKMKSTRANTRALSEVGIKNLKAIACLIAALGMSACTRGGDSGAAGGTGGTTDTPATTTDQGTVGVPGTPDTAASPAPQGQ